MSGRGKSRILQAGPGLSTALADLRRLAEERVRIRQSAVTRARSEGDAVRLVHELEVHQVELEMLNEELLESRAALEAGLAKYSDLYDFAPVGYLTMDRDGTIREANLAVASLLGLERSRLIGRRLGLYVCPASVAVLDHLLEKAFTSSMREQGTFQMATEGVPPLVMRIEVTWADVDKHYRAIVTDITEQLRAEMDRLVMSKLESTGRLAGGIAHDFNNLLMVILLNIEQVRSFPSSCAESERYMDDAKEAIMTARGLTQQLITFADGGRPNRRPTALARIIRDGARAALSGSRVRCEFQLPDDLWWAHADEAQISQVIRNVVFNARESMPEGGQVAVRAENCVLDAQAVVLLPPGEYVCVSVVDRGVGISRDVLAKIFDPYFSTKTRGSDKGMGLGLTICHAIVQKHDGAIVVASELKTGTTVRLYLPALRKEPIVELAPLPVIHAGVARILVMDDDAALRRLLEATLLRIGYQVEMVADGEAAIDAYVRAREQGRPFDLVILNLMVRAGLGGQEAMQALLKIDPNVKAIVTSGHANDPVVIDPARYGFKGALAKPFDTGKLQLALIRMRDERA